MSFFSYGNGVSIDVVKYELQNPTETFESLKAVFEAIVKRYHGAFDMEDLSIRYYAYDDRIEKDVYIVLTNRYCEEDYIEKYKSPQFIGYLVSV